MHQFRGNLPKLTPLIMGTGGITDPLGLHEGQLIDGELFPFIQ